MRRFAENPFPGMNPWLERRWGDVHLKLTAYAADHIQTQLPPDLVARGEEYLSVVDRDARVGRLAPDTFVVDVRDDAPMGMASGGAAVLDEPVVVEFDDSPLTLRYIRITDINDDRLVTAIEFLSPANKIGREGRRQYRDKQQRIIESEANLIEIDLIRSGDWVLAANPDRVPDHCRGPYRVCVTRATPSFRHEMYPASFHRRLPNLRVPLREKDDDVGLNLQELIDTVYVRSRYGTIDYDQPPEPPLSGAAADWVEDHLRKVAGSDG